METFKAIKGFENYYEVSDLGNVKSLIGRFSNVVILKYGISGSGYPTVTLCKNGKRYSKTIHRLVVETFLGSSELIVNHKDGNKLNNKLSNLELVTRSENTKHAIENGLLKPNYNKIAVDTRKKILQIDIKNNAVINTFQSAHEASRITKINRGNICSVCRGEKEIAGNYKWKYYVN